jgi:hypothetical protein
MLLVTLLFKFLFVLMSSPVVLLFRKCWPVPLDLGIMATKSLDQATIHLPHQMGQSRIRFEDIKYSEYEEETLSILPFIYFLVTIHTTLSNTLLCTKPFY